MSAEERPRQGRRVHQGAAGNACTHLRLLLPFLLFKGSHALVDGEEHAQDGGGQSACSKNEQGLVNLAAPGGRCRAAGVGRVQVWHVGSRRVAAPEKKRG